MHGDEGAKQLFGNGANIKRGCDRKLLRLRQKVNGSFRYLNQDIIMVEGPVTLQTSDIGSILEFPAQEEGQSDLRHDWQTIVDILRAQQLKSRSATATLITEVPLGPRILPDEVVGRYQTIRQMGS